MIISEVQVLESNPGWYIGRTCSTENGPQDEPYDRMSDYFYSKWEALKVMGATLVFNATMKEIEQELEKARKTNHPLIAKRVEFLEHAKECFSATDKDFTWKWNYSVDATPSNAIIK